MHQVLRCMDANGNASVFDLAWHVQIGGGKHEKIGPQSTAILLQSV